MTLVAVILLASLLMTPSASVDKEGFITYVVYGPGWGYGTPNGWGWPGYGRGWGGPGGWPYWGWRRHWYRGPCPGPWCPYY